MKFATIALVASVSAIQIRSEDCHGTMAQTNAVFKEIDTNGNGQIDEKELKTALIALADHMHHKVTAEEAAWIEKTASAVAGSDDQMNPAEFNKWGNMFVNHFGLCGEAEAAAGLAEVEVAKCHGNMKQTNKVFDEIDTNGNGQISAKELKTALLALAKEMGHKITAEEAAWVKKTAGKAAGKDEQMNRKEFNRWGNLFVNHMGLCDAAEEAVGLAEVEADKCHASQADTDAAFKKIDTNGNGQINRKELKRAVMWIAKQMNHTITKEEAEWVAKTAGADAGKDQTLSPKEFNKFANTFVNHFGLCGEM